MPRLHRDGALGAGRGIGHEGPPTWSCYRHGSMHEDPLPNACSGDADASAPRAEVPSPRQGRPPGDTPVWRVPRLAPDFKGAFFRSAPITQSHEVMTQHGNPTTRQYIPWLRVALARLASTVSGRMSAAAIRACGCEVQPV
jgi:hypothetical protein